MKSPCFFVEIFAEKRREVCLMRGQDTVSVLKGVGEQREKRLHRLGIVTVEDLLTHYPREYKDRSEILKIADLPPDEPATFLAQIKEEGQNSRHGRLVYTRMKVYDETGAVGVLWYNQPYMKSSLKIGEWYLFSGIKIYSDSRYCRPLRPAMAGSGSTDLLPMRSSKIRSWSVPAVPTGEPASIVWPRWAVTVFNPNR